MRFAHIIHIIGITASILGAAYLTFVGYTLHRDATAPGTSFWQWTPAVSIILIGVAIFHLGFWRLLHAIHALREFYAESSPNKRSA